MLFRLKLKSPYTQIKIFNEMKKTAIKLVALIGCAIIMASCSDGFWNCVDGNGNITSARRVIGDFSKVENSGEFIVDVTIGPVNRVIVEADDNLLSYIETYIQGNTLVIETQNNHCIKSREPIHVYVITPVLSELKLSGSGVIYCDSLTTNEISLVLTGSGDIDAAGINANLVEAVIEGSGEINISGTAVNTNFIIEGSGNIKSLNLEQDKCIASILGSGNIYAFVNESLDALIEGSGNVIYKGDPAIVSEILGSGRVIKY